MPSTSLLSVILGATALASAPTRAEVIEIVLNATQYRGHPAARRAAKIVGAALNAEEAKIADG